MMMMKWFRTSGAMNDKYDTENEFTIQSRWLMNLLGNDHMIINLIDYWWWYDNLIELIDDKMFPQNAIEHIKPVEKPEPGVAMVEHPTKPCAVRATSHWAWHGMT